MSLERLQELENQLSALTVETQEVSNKKITHEQALSGLNQRVRGHINKTTGRREHLEPFEYRAVCQKQTRLKSQIMCLQKQLSDIKARRQPIHREHQALRLDLGLPGANTRARTTKLEQALRQARDWVTSFDECYLPRALIAQIDEALACPEST